MYTEYDYNNSLCHFGTKGMRWGRRRYQYENGIYTPLGESRRTGKNNPNKKNAVKSKIQDHKKKIQNLSEEERKERNKKRALIAAGTIAAVGVTAVGVHHASKILKGREAINKQLQLMKDAENHIKRNEDKLRKAKELGDTSSYLKDLDRKIESYTKQYVTADDKLKQLSKQKGNAKYAAEMIRKYR